MRELAGLAVLALIAAGTAPASAAKGSQAMTVTDANRAIGVDFARLPYTERNARAAFEEYVAPGYIQHSAGRADGPEAAMTMLTKLFGGPGATFEIQRILVDGDTAAIHLRGGPDTSGKGVAVIDLCRLRDGKIDEHWDVLQPVPDTVAKSYPMF